MKNRTFVLSYLTTLALIFLVIWVYPTCEAKSANTGELGTILGAAVRNDLRPELYPLLLAIRRSESGPKGLEFGIMHPRAKYTNLDTQAGWAAATVQKNWDRWIKAGKKGKFIVFLGNRWAPIGAANDPTGLNKNWITNVTYWSDHYEANFPRNNDEFINR